VAIIGILTSIAIPSFKIYQMRSKRSEAYANLGSIAHTQSTYFAENGIYWNVAAMPGPAPTRFKRDWNAAARAAYAPIGWIPEGDVYYDYDVNTATIGGCGCTVCFTASAYGELDGDGLISTTMYALADDAGNTCPAGVTGDPVPLDGGGNVIVGQPVVSPASDDF
jgi:Tfp pilus assembly protein PilE